MCVCVCVCRYVFRMCVCVCVSHMQGVDFAPWSRLSEWVFDVDMLTVMPEYSLTQADQTDALTHVLQCLRDLRTAPSTVVEFREWDWDEGMARVMCEGLREVTHLRVGVFVDSVTDEWMGHALMMGEW